MIQKPKSSRLCERGEKEELRREEEGRQGKRPLVCTLLLCSLTGRSKPLEFVCEAYLTKK